MKSLGTLLILVLVLGSPGGLRADGSPDSLSRQLLKAYPYRIQPYAFFLGPYPTVAIYSPTGPNFQPRKPSDADLRRLAEALAADRARRPALWIWDLPHGAQLQGVGRPDVQKLDIPWEPNAVTPDFALSASGVQSASSRLELRVPLLTFVP